MTSDWPHGDAFVLQLGPKTDLAAGRLEGRIEHVASMRSARFSSLEELIAFLQVALADCGASREDNRCE